jgi:hypothetical protein
MRSAGTVRGACWCWKAFSNPLHSDHSSSFGMVCAAGTNRKSLETRRAAPGWGVDTFDLTVQVKLNMQMFYSRTNSLKNRGRGQAIFAYRFRRFRPVVPSSTAVPPLTSLFRLVFRRFWAGGRKCRCTWYEKAWSSVLKRVNCGMLISVPYHSGYKQNQYKNIPEE